MYIYLHVYTSRQPRNEVRQRASFANFEGGGSVRSDNGLRWPGRPDRHTLIPPLRLRFLFFSSSPPDPTPGDGHVDSRASQMSNQPPIIDPEIGAFSAEGSFSILIYTLYTFITERSRFAGRPRSLILLSSKSPTRASIAIAMRLVGGL